MKKPITHHDIHLHLQALKAEIQQLKSSSSLATSAAPAAPLATTTADTSEMASKLASYQSFMAEYIVNSQNEKLLAVKEAELKAENKFRERLNALFEASEAALPGDDAVVEPAAVVVVAEETVFQKRNAQIVAAASAGKSRWGSMEVARAESELANAPAASSDAAVVPPPEVAATVFEQRNAQVVAAASAGKSRWGSMEVERAAGANGSAAPAATAVVEEKAAAPVSLEDRVNLGARLLGA